MSEPEYQPKARLVLEGSDKHEWGVVKDCHGSVNTIPPDAEVVGTWNKYGEGIFWVSLETPIQALQDKATIHIAELAERRKKEEELRVLAPKRATTSRPRRTREEKPEEEENPALTALQRMRDKLHPKES